MINSFFFLVFNCGRSQLPAQTFPYSGRRRPRYPVADVRNFRRGRPQCMVADVRGTWSRTSAVGVRGRLRP
jgi:hypothetical protein